MSFDGLASPSITLKPAQRQSGDQPFGWGFAWYPRGDNAAVVIKDPTSIGENAMTKVLRDWERFQSCVFLCHIRGAAQRITQQDTHPFERSFAGRDWIIAHNGDIEGDLEGLFPLEKNSPFEPIGLTDTEHVFCWLLDQVRGMGARCLADVGWHKLYAYFTELNKHGTANFLLSDGQDLVVYHDKNRFNGLHWTRRLPPHKDNKLENDEVSLDFSDEMDTNRTVCVISTKALKGDDYWVPFEAGQMLVLRRGAIVWNSQGAAITPAILGATGDTSARVKKHTGRVQVAIGEQTAARKTHTHRRSHSGRMRAVASTVRVFNVLHETKYQYVNPVERSTHVFRLKPVIDATQHLLNHTLSINVDGLRRDFDDVFGNSATHLEVETPFKEMVISSRSLVRVDGAGCTLHRSPARRLTIPLVWMPWQRQMMNPYLLPPELPETQLSELSDFAMSFVERQDFDLLETLVDMNLTIYRDFHYVSGSTRNETTPFEVYTQRKGVCQDFANLFICLARLLGIPARYRVGYIYTGANYQNKVQSEASHAWAELYLPWVGWRGFDPTNGCVVGSDHMRVACGRNYLDATPTSGTIYAGGGPEALSVDVRVAVANDADLAELNGPGEEG